MKWAPKSYQSEALDFVLAHERAALWLEMGLGKTSVAATAIAELMDRAEVSRVLVVAPKRVIKSVWPQELAKWDHLDVPIREIEGSMRQRARLLDSPWCGVETINYEKLKWLFRDYLKGRELPWDMVIFDESSKLKAVGTQRFRAIRRRVTDLNARRILQLTGSPAPSGLLNVWAPTFLLDGGERLGRTYTAFRDRWFTTDFMGWAYLPRAGADEFIYNELADITLSMRSADHLDLPPLIVNDIWVDMPAGCQADYRELEDEMFLQLEHDTVEAANGGVLTNKCRQFANGALYVNGSTDWRELHDAKFEALDDVIEENSGKPLLVAYQFKSDLARLRKRLPRATVYNEAKDPIELESRWNRGEVPLMLIHPGSAGHGLNLQGGTDTLVLFGLGWSFDQYDQVIARIAGGLRRERPTFVHRLLTSGTVDRSVVEAIEGRRAVQDVLKDEVKRRRAAKGYRATSAPGGEVGGRANVPSVAA